MSQNLRPAEISSILQQEIGKYDSKLKMETVGTVLQVGDGIARVWGLDKVMSAELVEFIPTKTDGKPVEPIFGMALNLEEDHVGCVVLGDDSKIKEGDEVRTTGRITQVPVGPALIGRVVNALGQPLDNKGPIATKEYRPIEGRSPNVVQRQPVKEPLQTGWLSVDSMIPIGRGQRELIIGDRQTGKTAITLDAIINQKEENVICIC